jgi:mannose-1-phosphate guanylyltransferase
VKFFILAGGYGKRAEPLSLFKPKPAFPLNGVPLLRLLLRQLHAQNCREGFINLHHLAGQVVAAAGSGHGIRFIEEKKLSGSRILQQALPFFSDWLLAVNGDTFLDIPLAELMHQANNPDIDGILLVRHDDSGRYARLHCAGDEFLERSEPQPGQGLMYAGAALFRKRAVEKMEEASFFNSIKKNRLRFKIVLYDGIWLDIGTPASYFQANWQYMTHGSDPRNNAVSKNVKISRRSRLERTVLWENTRIGPGVQLSECIVTGGLELENTCRHGQIISEQGVYPLF